MRERSDHELLEQIATDTRYVREAVDNFHGSVRILWVVFLLWAAYSFAKSWLWPGLP
jgi:hypothetical protein